MSLKAADLVDVRSSSPQSSGRGKQTTTMSVAALLNSTRVPAFINFVSLGARVYRYCEPAAQSTFHRSQIPCLFICKPLVLFINSMFLRRRRGA
jgi:hypothetical protein